MLSEEIKSIQTSLGELAGKIAEEDWVLVKMARLNLGKLAEQVESLENNFSLTESV